VQGFQRHPTSAGVGEVRRARLGLLLLILLIQFDFCCRDSYPCRRSSCHRRHYLLHKSRSKPFGFEDVLKWQALGINFALSGQGFSLCLGLFAWLLAGVPGSCGKHINQLGEIALSQAALKAKPTAELLSE